MDPLRNTKDPLRKTGPEAEQHLFRLMSKDVDGFPLDVVVGAAMNLVVNAIRQSEPTQEKARKKYDELTGKVKSILLDKHYDLSGSRKNIYPFNQNISVPFLDLRSKAA